tara:strand:+ start:203 stop:826 length:624 start_codon:yes stop_codon:yes gene_type:complete
VKGIVFDLDGTLVDSLPDILNSFCHAFEVVGLPVPDKDEVNGQLGKTLWDMYCHFAPSETISELVAVYRDYYPRHFLDNSRIFPGVKDVLTQLRNLGFSLAIATTKRTISAIEFTNALGLDSYFDHIQGTDDFACKPSPEVIHRALGALGKTGLWMVGDSSTDIEAGKAARLSTYAVTWGAHDVKRLRKSNPDALESSLDRLIELVI